MTGASSNSELVRELIPVADDVPLEAYVSQLNRVSRERSLGVLVVAEPREGERPVVRFTGPTGTHRVVFVGVDDVTPLGRVHAHAEGFFGATREHFQCLTAGLLEERS